MIDKTQCLYVYLLLYGGAILALFARAYVRRSLLEYCERLPETPGDHESGSRLARLFLAISRQTGMLRKLGKSVGNAPEPVRAKHRAFRILTVLAWALIIGLVIFSFTAHRVCGG
jgi:hypothetical protein